MAYATVADVRAQAAGETISDASRFPDSVVTDAIAYAESRIDEYCRTSFEPKPFRSVSTGDGTRAVVLEDEFTGRRIVHPRTITSVSIDGEALDPSEWASWVKDPQGVVYRDTGTFPCGSLPRNIVIEGTAARTLAADPAIKRCTAVMAAEQLRSTADPKGERILADADGALAVAGKYGPSNTPSVNATLSDPTYRAHTPVVA